MSTKPSAMRYVSDLRRMSKAQRQVSGSKRVFIPIGLSVLFLALVGIFVSAGFSLLLLPPRPEHQPRYKTLVMLAQWILLPVTLIIWGAIPATVAQTRLMFGKYLGFWVTEKVRK